MRNQWRMILLRCNPRSQFHIPRCSSHSHIISSFHSLAPQKPPNSFHQHLQNPETPNFRCYSSSELAVEYKDSDQVIAVIDILSKSVQNNDEIKLEFERSGINLSHDLVVDVLSSSNVFLDAARKFFDWVSEVDNTKLSSKSYNWMLGILGSDGLVNDFWDLVEKMKKKGFGVSKGAYVRALNRFEKDGLENDLKKLKELYSAGSPSRICKIIRQDLWGDDVEKRIRELNVTYSSELVASVLKNLDSGPDKALMFFRWVEENELFKHDALMYNTMARILGREDSSDNFWKVVDEMKESGYEMEMDTYIQVLGEFVKSKKLKDAVDLYEFAMGGVITSPLQEFTFILRKIVGGSDLDMDLFSRVVRIYKENGNTITNSTLDSVFKSLTGAGKFDQCNKVLTELAKAGFLPSESLQSKIAYTLSSDGKNEEVKEFIENLEESGVGPNYKISESLVEGYYVAGDLDKAYDSFKKLIESGQGSSAGYSLELLVTSFCSKNREMEVFKLISETVSKRKLRPWRSTYKVLTDKLLRQKKYKEALTILGLMKYQGYPPLLDEFIRYLSKKGTSDDAVEFLKEMTVKNFARKSVIIRIFEAYFRARRHEEAQDFFSKCPKYIHKNAYVLDLFSKNIKSSGESVTEETAVAEAEETSVADAKETSVAEAEVTAVAEAEETSVAEAEETAVAEAEETAVAEDKETFVTV